MIHFTKMHGAGNDYVYVDCTDGMEIDSPSELAVKISDRHYGVGSDGLVLICRSHTADFKMRMFNADGSEAQMCGNAARCIGKYVWDKGLTKKTDILLETRAGIKFLHLLPSGNMVSRVRVDMGAPEFAVIKIPVHAPSERVVDMPHTFAGREFKITCASMGNPHAVVFVDSVDDFEVERWGRIIENDPIFPERTNVEFIQNMGNNHLKMRVWERGSGETLACGTGACAAVAAASLRGVVERCAVVHLLGGMLEVEWTQDNHILMTGDAVEVFTGDYAWK